MLAAAVQLVGIVLTVTDLVACRVTDVAGRSPFVLPVLLLAWGVVGLAAPLYGWFFTRITALWGIPAHELNGVTYLAVVGVTRRLSRAL
jgi:hypothetical protein